MPPEPKPASPGLPNSWRLTRQATGRTMPDQRTLLAGLLAGRILAAVGLLVGAGVIWAQEPEISFPVSLIVILAFTITVYGYWAIWLRGGYPGTLFFCGQALADLGLVTALVHFTGGYESAFPALYIVVIAAYALLMNLRPGLMVPLLASLLYFLDIYWFQPSRVGVGFWGQVAIFTAAYGFVGVLAARLRTAGAERRSEERRVGKECRL